MIRSMRSIIAFFLLSLFFVQLVSAFSTIATVEISNEEPVIELIAIGDGPVFPVTVRVVDNNGVDDIMQSSLQLFQKQDDSFIPISSFDLNLTSSSEVVVNYVSEVDLSDMGYGTYMITIHVDDHHSSVERSQEFIYQESSSPTGFAVFSTETLKKPFTNFIYGIKRLFSWIKA